MRPVRRFLALPLALALGLTATVLLAPERARAADLMVFAAASLHDVLREVAADYARDHGTGVTFNFAASSLLARQIRQGAPADLFISADDRTMDELERENLVEQTRRDLLGNTLVVVLAQDHPARVASARDLASDQIGRIALGEPSSVPAGRYAKEWLTQEGIWDRVAPKVVPTANVRAALAAVEAGNADAAIIYRTDAARSRRTITVIKVPEAGGPCIRYPAAVVRSSRDATEARRFLEFLEGGRARRIFEKHGFTVHEPPGASR